MLSKIYHPGPKLPSAPLNTSLAATVTAPTWFLNYFATNADGIS